MDEFRGRVAVITGAASGIGRGMARHAAREGMRVVLADVEAAALDDAVADVAGVEDVVNTAQGFDRFGAKQPVGIGEDADQ